MILGSIKPSFCKLYYKLYYLVTLSFDAATQQVCLSCGTYWTEIQKVEYLYLIGYKHADVKVSCPTLGLLIIHSLAHLAVFLLNAVQIPEQEFE